MSQHENLAWAIQRLLEVFVLNVKVLPQFLMICNVISHNENMKKRFLPETSEALFHKKIYLDPIMFNKTMTDYGSCVSIIIDEHETE